MAKHPISRRDPQPEDGPAWRALPPQWRKAVDNLFLMDFNQTAALRASGYKGTTKSLTEMGSRIFRDPRVRAAIRERYIWDIDLHTPEVMAQVRRFVFDPEEKTADRLRAADMYLQRGDPAVTKHKIEVEHHITEDERDILHYRALQRLGAPPEKFLQRFGRNGLPRVEALVLAEEARRREIEAPTIEVEYDEVHDA